MSEKEIYENLIVNEFVKVEKIQKDNFEIIPKKYAINYISSADEITRNKRFEKGDNSIACQTYCITCKEKNQKENIYITIRNNTKDKYFFRYYFLNKIYYFDDLVKFFNDNKVLPTGIIKDRQRQTANVESKFIINEDKITISKTEVVIERKNVLFYREEKEYTPFAAADDCIHIFMKDNSDMKICFESWSK